MFPTYEFGEFVLDPNTPAVSRRGSHVPLQGKPYSCVLHLIRNRNRAVGRDELMMAVWGHRDRSDNALTQAILQARRAFADDKSGRDVIRTVRGIGYRWTAPVVEHSSPRASPQIRRACGDWLRKGASFATIAALAASVAADVAAPRDPASSSPSAAAACFESGNARPTALLLPVVNATGVPSPWIRLGMMDFISSRLRAAGQPILSTDAAIALVHAQESNVSAEATAGAHDILLLEAEVRLHDGRWYVSIRSLCGMPPALQAIGEGDDLLAAARIASDRFASALNDRRTSGLLEYSLVTLHQA